MPNDIGDHQHMKSFVTISDDKDEKEKKENRLEYKFRQRVFAEKRNKRKNHKIFVLL